MWSAAVCTRDPAGSFPECLIRARPRLAPARTIDKGGTQMSNIDMNGERQLSLSELETVTGGSPSLAGVIKGADEGSKAGSAFGQSHFGDIGGAVGGVVGAVVGA